MGDYAPRYLVPSPGDFFAHAFYSPSLYGQRPSSAHIFSAFYQTSPLHEVIETEVTINLLWKSATWELAEPLVRKLYPDAEYKGAFTDRNYLVIQGVKPCPIKKQHILLQPYADGPIRRTPPLQLASYNPGVHTAT